MNPKPTDQAQLHESIVRQLYRRSGATGQIQLPAVPGLIDEYVTMCDTLFAGVGRKFTAEELAHLRELLADQLAQAYAASPRSMITISNNAPSSQLLNYHIKPEWWTIEGDYEKEHLPDGAWPPTNWYPNWTAGQDVFDLQREYVPIDMRWLVYRRTA